MELSPAATKYPRRFGASPTMGSRSGVKLSGPQKNFFMPTSAVIGTRAIAVSRYGAMRSQSGARSANGMSVGACSTFHGAHTGSNNPTMRPAPSWR